MVMTCQYVAGELSQLIAKLGTAAQAEEEVTRELSALRRQAETQPLAGLGPGRHVRARHRGCAALTALTHGDMAGFQQRAPAMRRASRGRSAHSVDPFGTDRC
jgi:hypothetical protein